MRVLTIEDTESIRLGLFKPLEESLSRAVIELVKIPTYDKKIGNISKIVKLWDYLLTLSDLSDNEIIVFCDAHDVVYAPPSENVSLEDFFVATKLDFLVSSENASAHHILVVKEWFTQKYGGKHHLNSGVQIGYLGAFKKIYKHLNDNLQRYNINNQRSDQRILSQFFVEQVEYKIIPDLVIGLDCNELLAFTVNSKTPLQWNWKSYFVHITWLKNPDQRKKHERVCTSLNLLHQNQEGHRLARVRCIKS